VKHADEVDATVGCWPPPHYPHRVTEIMLSAISTTRQSEIGWLYRGAGQFFPEEWERFRDGSGMVGPDGDLVAAYARLMEDPDSAPGWSKRWPGSRTAEAPWRF
jgi:proline iminopeptidase